MIELVDMEQATPFDRLLVVLVGKSYVGKSRLASTARKGVLFFDWDGKRDSLAGRKGVRAITLRDPGDITKPAAAFNDGLGKLSQLEYKQTFSNIGFKNVPPEEDIIKTVVVDSMYSMARAANRFIKSTTADLRRTIKIGNLEVYLNNGWDTWNAEIESVEGFIFRLLAIPKIDVILIFHEDDEESPGSSQEKRLYTGRFEPYPARYGNILKYFNEMWRLTRQSGGEPQVQMAPNYQFQASSNLGIDRMTKADITALIEEYQAKNKGSLRPSEAGVQTLPSAELKAPVVKGVV